MIATLLLNKRDDEEESYQPFEGFDLVSSYPQPGVQLNETITTQSINAAIQLYPELVVCGPSSIDYSILSKRSD